MMTQICRSQLRKKRILVLIASSTIFAIVMIGPNTFDAAPQFSDYAEMKIGLKINDGVSAARDAASVKMAPTSDYNNNEVIVESDPVGPPPRCLKNLIQLWTKNSSGENINDRFPSCGKIITAVMYKTGDKRLLAALKKWTVPEPHDDNSTMEMLSNCTHFRSIVDFHEKPLSKEEEDYPLAYVFVPLKHLAQTVRMFRSIYQPQNVYCINYDTKINKDYKNAILKMASCFPFNVFINPNPQAIYYSTFSLVSTVMDCFDALRKHPIKWNYVQIVSWNDFPLQTNLEMVRIFKTLNGSQDCEMRHIPGTELMLYEYSGVLYKLGHIPKPIPPGGITFYQGSYSTTMTREFIDWMFTDPVSIRLYHYVNNTQFPDEFYWTSLIHNTHLNAPGNFPGQCSLFFKADEKPYLSRFQMWKWDTPRLKCHGYFEHSFCIFGAKDLGLLMKRKELVVHKIYQDYQPGLLYCLEEWYWEKVCKGEPNMDMKYYQMLPSVVYHNLPPEEKESFVCNFQGRSRFE